MRWLARGHSNHDLLSLAMLCFDTDPWFISPNY